MSSNAFLKHANFRAADDMSTPNVKEGMQASGVNSILPKEHGAKFYTLPFVKNSEKDVSYLSVS